MKEKGKVEKPKAIADKPCVLTSQVVESTTVDENHHFRFFTRSGVRTPLMGVRFGLGIPPLCKPLGLSNINQASKYLTMFCSSWAVGSLVVRASDSRPEGLGLMPMPPNTLRVHT
ncbi:hypothetical protein TNCV_4968741 [Trichonephila clavipes]|nr:hypothetical protein TNCV_4968741 [Trichonephila clavipes]